MQHRIPIKRIQQEMRDLAKNRSYMYSAGPVENELFHWHFTIRGPPETCFEQGIYHGRIEFSYEYPFKPPDIYFMTPNGRYEINTKICLSITTYHPEEWKPAWTARTMLEALISTLPERDEKIMGLGGLNNYSESHLRTLAQRSRTFVCDKCGPIADLLIEKPTEQSKTSADGEGDDQQQQQQQQGDADTAPNGAPSANKEATQTENDSHIQAQIETRRQEEQEIQIQLRNKFSALLNTRQQRDQNDNAERVQRQHQHHHQHVHHHHHHHQNANNDGAKRRERDDEISFEKVLTNIGEYQQVVESIKFTPHPNRLLKIEQENEIRNAADQSARSATSASSSAAHDEPSAESVARAQAKIYSSKEKVDLCLFFVVIVLVLYFFMFIF